MTESLHCAEKNGGVQFDVRVTPKASRDAIVGVHAGALKVALTAPPVAGAANRALCKLLAKELGVPKGHVEVVRGGSSRSKTVRIEGLTATALPW